MTTRGKRITVAAVRAKINALTERDLANCYLHLERHWGGVAYELVFTGEDVDDGARHDLRFDKIQEVWDWLRDFEKRANERRVIASQGQTDGRDAEP